MEELLIIILQALFEFALNVLVNIPFDWPFRNRRTPEPVHLGWRCVLWFSVGCAAGALSLLFIKHTLIRVGALRVVNVAVAPIAAALVSQSVARRWAKTNENIRSRNHYWRAFWLTLGFALVRFAYAPRA